MPSHESLDAPSPQELSRALPPVWSAGRALDRRDWIVATLLGTIAFFCLIRASPFTLRHGDAVQYAHLIAARDLSLMTIHAGYNLLGVMWLWLLPVSVDTALSVGNCFFGAMSVLLVCLLARLLSGRIAAGVLAGTILLTNTLFVLESIYPEVYVSQLFFVLLTLFTWVLQRPILTGLAYAAAHLISPSSVFVLPALIILRPDVRMLLHAGLVAGFIVLPTVLWHLGNYVSGFLFSAGHPFVAASAVAKEAEELTTGFVGFVLFFVVGVADVVGRRQGRLLAALGSMWLVTFFFGERTYDVPVQLPVYACMAVLAGMGADRALLHYGSPPIPRLGWWMSLALLLSLLVPSLSSLGWGFMFAVTLSTLIAGAAALFVRRAASLSTRRIAAAVGLLALVGLNALVASDRVGRENQRTLGLRQTLTYLDENSAPGYLVIASYNQGMLFDHYVNGLTFTGRWLHPDWLLADEGWGLRFQGQAQKRWRETVAARDEVWFLGLEHPDLVLRLQDELKAAGYTVEEIVPGLRRAAWGPEHFMERP